MSTYKLQLSAELERDISAGTPLRIELGGGENPRPGFHSFDCRQVSAGSSIVDLERDLSFLSDNSVSHTYSCHTLEHIQHLSELMREIYRVSTPGGIVEVKVPHFSNPYGYSDPTHVRFFGLYSMNYFAKEGIQWSRPITVYDKSLSFRLDGVTVKFYPWLLGWRKFTRLFQKWVNRSTGTQEFYETHLSRFLPAHEVLFVLSVLKA
jgi:hypothetical protein